MNPKNLVPAGVGEHDALGSDRAKNRRIEIALLPAINDLPPLPVSHDEAKKSDPAQKP